MKPERLSSVADASARSDTHEDVQHNHASVATDELTSLRALLVGPEQQQLHALQERIDNLTVHAEDVGRVLPEAILLRLRQDQQLPKALTPLIENTFQDSVRNTPQLWVDSLFPVIGPAIRRAIAHTLRGMLASLNQTLEQSLSLRSIQWRLEAWRTGKPFSEIVMLRTLRYRVEQAFLIHNKTGLLLQHVVAPTVAVPEGDLIAGMLTAIQDFVQDSFSEPKGQTLETVQMGDFTVWVERGAEATLAAVIRGNAPEELREVFQDTLDSIHTTHRRALTSFQGDSTPFAGSGERLEACLQAQRTTSPEQSFLAWKVAGVVLLVMLGLWIFLVMRDNRRWEHYLARLHTTPGIVITTAEKRSGKFFVTGLRDPLAHDPIQLLAGTQLDPEQVRSKWEPYHALYPDFILARAKAALAPPLTVTLSLVGETLTAVGSAPSQWITDSRKIARAIPGVSDFKTDGVIDTDELLRRELEASKARLETSAIYFIVETTNLVPGQEDTLTNLTTEVQRFFDLARQAGKGFRLEIAGHTDTSGMERKNDVLGRARAESIFAMLVSRGIPKDTLVVVGAKERVREERMERDKELNRCVLFRAVPAETSRMER